MGRAIIFLLLISCTKTDEDMKLFLDNIGPNTPTQSILKIKLTDGDQNNTYVSTILGDKELRQTLELFKPISNRYPNNLDYSNVYLDGVYVKKGGEDCAPYRIMNTTIGGNHGYYKNFSTVVGHDKQDVDIGSIWNNGTYDCVLYSIYDSDILWIDGDDSNGLTYTHVSGGTNTSSFTVTARTNLQFYPVTQNHTLVLNVDDIEVPIEDNEYVANNDIVFNESYEILSDASMRQWLIDNVGTVNRDSQLGGTSMVRVTNTVRYTRLGNTLTNDFLVLPAGDGIAFSDIMFAMGFEMIETATYPNLRTYIPKTLPFSQDGLDHDFANIETYNADSWPTRIDITPSRAEATGIFSDRHIYLTDGLGFSMGFLPVYDADPSVRRLRCNNKAMQLAVGGKIYMSAVDDDSKTTLNDGDYYKVIAYKYFFENNDNRTAYYIVDSDEGSYYLYADWHNLPYNDTLDIPLELVGMSTELIEKSDNVTYNTDVLKWKLDVSITSDESYGYLILKI